MFVLKNNRILCNPKLIYYKDFHQYVKSIKKKFKTCSSQTSLIHTDDEKDSSDEWSSRSQWSSLSPTSSSSSLDVDL